MEAVAAVVPALETTDSVFYGTVHNDSEVSGPTFYQITDPDPQFSPKA